MKNPWYFVSRTKVEERVKKYQIFKLDTFELKRVINHNFSVIQMNSNFIELTNRNYVWKGKKLIFLSFFGIPFVLLVLFGGYLFLKDGIGDLLGFLISLIFVFLISLYMLLTMLIPFLKIDFLKPLYLPVVINRQKKTMTVCSDGNSTSQFLLDDLYFDIVQSQGVVGLPLHELQWFLFLENSNPFYKAIIKDHIVFVQSTNGVIFSIPIDNPQLLQVVKNPDFL